MKPRADSLKIFYIIGTHLARLIKKKKEITQINQKEERSSNRHDRNTKDYKRIL